MAAPKALAPLVRGEFDGGQFGFVLGSFRKMEVTLAFANGFATQQTYLAFVGWVGPRAKPIRSTE